MRLWLYCLGGLLYDWLVFVFWTAVPVRAEQVGASATQVGLLQMASTGCYVLGSLWMGRLSDRVSRARLARWGGFGALAACLLVAQAGTLPALFLSVPVLGLAASTYWPAVQGAIGAETPPEELEHALGLFNVTWSLGKTVGFAMAGWMLAHAGHGTTLLLAATSAIPIMLLYPKDVAAAPRARFLAEPPPSPAFRTLGYVSNFAAFGLGAAFQNQFFKYLAESGLRTRWDRETYFGAFLGVIFGAQTLTFWVLQRSRGWAYRRSLLYGAQFLGVAGALLICAARHDLWILALAPVLGVSLGFAYASSIHYSLHGPGDHGKYAGLHEAVLGAGTVLVPLLGGWLADRTGDPRMPYLLAAGVVLAAVAVEEGVYRKSPRS
jgi:MFS family permease